MPNETRQSLIFEAVEHAAAEGKRCPTNPELAALLRSHGIKAAAGGIPTALNQLIRDGWIVVSLYPRYWRVVTICAGPLVDMRTAPPPSPAKPHIVLDKAERKRRDAEFPSYRRSQKAPR